jgi:hypothetical protein
MPVGFSRQLLDPTPCVIDSPVIPERKVEAASAVLDVLWTILAEKNAADGESTPLPALIQFDPVLLRRRLRRALS